MNGESSTPIGEALQQNLDPDWSTFLEGAFRVRHPASVFLDEFGLRDAIIMSRWVKEVGQETFVDMILAFSKPDANGRPESNYSPFVNAYAKVKAENPSYTEHRAAMLVAEEAFKKNAWPDGFSPPSTVRAMADSIKGHVKRRASKTHRPPSEGDSQRAFAARMLVQRRVAALHENADRLVALGTMLDKAKHALSTPGA